MANTVNIGKPTTVTAGQGQIGQWRGSRTHRLIVLAVVTVLALALAAGATITRTRTTTVPQASTNGFANDPHVYTVWDFKEDRRDPALAPVDTSTSADYRWNYPPAGVVPAFDWEQQERTQVAPGTIPTSPTILPGSCQPGTSDCPPVEYVAPGAVPTSPTILPGSCQPGTSDCPLVEYYGPPPANYTAEGPR